MAEGLRLRLGAGANSWATGVRRRSSSAGLSAGACVLVTLGVTACSPRSRAAEPAEPWVAACARAGGSVVFVNGGHKGAERGTEGEPFRTIGSALGGASAGTKVLVAAGTYRETLAIARKAIHVCGGYSPDFRAFDPEKHVTTLVGDGASPVVRMTEAGASSLVGFWITGGKGGIEIEGGAALVARNVVEKNQRPGDRGGGLFIRGGQTRLLANIIRGNQARLGAGVFVTRGERIRIEGNTVEGNVGAGDHGGGLYLIARESEIVRNVIKGNETGGGKYGWGGGVIVVGRGNRARFSRNIFTDNVAPTYASAVFVDEGAEAFLENDLFFANRCGTRGGAAVGIDGGAGARSRATIVNATVTDHACGEGAAVLVAADGDAVVKSSIFWRNGKSDFWVSPGSTLAISHSLTRQKLPGAGLLDADPQFANPNARDYHLRSRAGRFARAAGRVTGDWVTDKSDSPALDAGEPGAPFGAEPQPNGGRVDLGCYGNTEEASRSSAKR